MFGYVRPLRRELKVREWENYQAAYCGLCHTLRRRCGWAARFTLNYDFTFLALLLDEGDPRPICPKRCVAHPLRPRPCLTGGGPMELAADESVILTYYQLKDGAADEGLWKRLGYRFAALFLRPSYRKAARRQGEFDRHVAECLEELRELEQANSPQLDRTADTFARILRAAAPREDVPGGTGPWSSFSTTWAAGSIWRTGWTT